MIGKIKNLKNHLGFRKYFFNTSWLLAEQGLRILSGLFIGVWVARYLGPEQFGVFSYALAFTAIFAGIAKLGLDGIMVRELVNHPEKLDTYLGTAFWLKILGAFIVMGLMAAIVPFTSNDATTNLFIFIISAGLVFQSFQVVEFYFQSQVLAKIVSICKVIQLALSSIIKIYLLLTEAELFWFVLVTAFDALSLAVSYFIAYQLRKNPTFYKHFDLSIAKQLLKNSWPLMIALVATMLYMRIDQIMLESMVGHEKLGIYAASVNIFEAWLILPAVISLSLMPLILSKKIEGMDAYLKTLSRIFSLAFWSSVLYALLVTIFCEDIIYLTFGEKYSEMRDSLLILVWLTPITAVGSITVRYLIAENKQKKILSRTIVGLTVNVLLNLLLIPIYGIEGAAIASFISMTITHFFMNYLHKDLSYIRQIILNSIYFKL